jgi:hypothetical protein
MSQDRSCACGRPLRENQTICADCVHRTRNHLANQAAWLEDIEVELARLARKTAANDGGRASDASMWAQAGDVFLDQITAEALREWDRRARAAADVMHEQRALLVAWCRMLVDEGIARELPRNTVWAMSAKINTHLYELRSHDAGPELVAEFRTLSYRIIKVIDSHENRTRIHVGPCPEEYTDEYQRKEPCPGQIEAIVPADETIAPVMRCGACKVEFRSDQWVRAGHRIQQREAQMRQQRMMAESIGRGRYAS